MNILRIINFLCMKHIYKMWIQRCTLCYLQTGSPFHPRVVDARKVRAKGEWQSKVDSEQRISLEVGKTKTLMFDVTEAGPGMLDIYILQLCIHREETIPSCLVI